MPRNFVAALAAAVFIVGTAAGTLSVVSAASLAQLHADNNGGTIVEFDGIL